MRDAPLLRRTLPALVACAALATCGGVATRTPDPTASEAEWRALAAPRPEALPGAARVSLGTPEVVGAAAWPPAAMVEPALGIAELVAAGLIRRRDVHFVERRRFAVAARAERSGARRPPGAPAAGVSPGSELTVGVVWLTLAPGATSLEVRLTDTATGEVRHAARAAVPPDAEAVAVARLVVGQVLAGLETLDRLPAWSDPVNGSAPRAHVPSGIDGPAVASFLRGLEAEERWDWEAARRGYQAAAADPSFFEAAAALARAARVRLGGTLGES